MTSKGKGKRNPEEAGTPLEQQAVTTKRCCSSWREILRLQRAACNIFLMKKIQQILWRYKCHLYFELINYSDIRYPYVCTLLKYNDQIAKVYVCRPVAARKKVPKIDTAQRSDSHRTVLGR